MYKIKNTELDFESRIFHLHKIFYSAFFPDKKPIINTFRSLSEIPVSSPESDAMSKDMKKRGFKFFGTTICYAHLQASGFINDHLTDCICRKVPQ
ncbi:hypothetical protein HMPREF1058_02038 [Phocaeicola vulgatus CL09T03C04]|uniref:DNA-3-methyladenine glycosylase I n=1 Tax=Phocaeicola vulgatus CL09T03C04 TaxID=997891 RepID=I9U9A2_PHOVU|nr:hypothetical protein HMPREF1058_02038 [Phocaeicola vulgatus CL09T03C04]